jgi:phage gp29-like protein
MTLTRRIANALFNRRNGTPPPLGRIAVPREADTWRSYPADGLTPQRLVSILRAADAGDLQEALALFEQMEEKDPHLFSVAQTRRLAVTGLPWRIVSAAEVEPDGPFDRGLADAAAEYCRAALRRIDRFEGVLRHLSLAIGRNIAVAELVWEIGEAGPELVDVVPVDFSRLTTGRLGEVRILTDDEPRDGVPLPPGKSIVHAPHAASGHPMRGGLMRVSALSYLGKHFAIKDWLIFAEIFGMPVRIARYEPNASPEEKRELLEMLRRLGADAAGIFSKAVELEIKQTRVPGDVNPYESLCHYFNRELSKAWLGQTLTTDTARAIANLSAAEVHDRVRRDLRDDDLRNEAWTLRRDLLGELTRLRFGDAAEPPHFRRYSEQPQDPRALGRSLSVAVNQLGLKVSSRWAHAALGIPAAVPGEEILTGRGGVRGNSEPD